MSNYSNALESRYRALGDSERAKAEGYLRDTQLTEGRRALLTERRGQ